jgi:hypothetical protein
MAIGVTTLASAMVYTRGAAGTDGTAAAVGVGVGVAGGGATVKGGGGMAFALNS